MCVYHKEKTAFLKRSIESVMSQTVLPDDFVIVCDGQLTDELYIVLDAASKKYHQINVVKKDEQEGLGLSLEYGLKHVKNDIVMRMDSDDVCLANRAEKQLPLMETYDLVGGAIQEFEEDESQCIGYRYVPEKYPEIKKFAKNRCPFNHPSIMYRKSLVETVGGYEDVRLLEDYYLWYKILSYTDKVYNIQEPLVNMRSGVVMRSRRGGKIFKKSHKYLKKQMYKTGFIGLFNYLFITPIQLISFSLPLKLKEFIYRILLRRDKYRRS